MKELSTKFNHVEVETGQYSKWLEKDLFKGDINSPKKKYSIVLPPPNVTGKLHLGHAMNVSLQDALIRFHKMNNHEVFWIPGMDHAGIATQTKVAQRLNDIDIDIQELGREKFLEKSFEWKEEYANHIRNEWSRMGLALDYSREVFTLDDNVNASVNKVFTELYKQGKIYKGSKIINWDPLTKTALSDIEVIYHDVQGNEHYFKYVNADDSTDYLEIMTTRPETMFGDGALAVHPDDERYKQFIGNKYIVPNTKTIIPLITDEYVDQEKGSGVVKITVAHDPNDYEVGIRHSMEPRIIMDESGCMMKNNYVPEIFQGLDRFKARQLQIETADKNGLLIKIVPLVHSVGHSERSNAIVEPLYSEQWFIKMDELAKEALEFQKTNEKVVFYPERFEKNFTKWMEGVHDWCISRQLWWGHRIPAWTNKQTGELFVGEFAPDDIENWIQDKDVLDTWFSSALWPFILTGKDSNKEEFEKLFPVNTLVTAYDIIFFWVSRMIFQSLEFTDQKPFNDVLIHGLIRDAEGRKMSKSLGNGIDPQEVIEKYGADALRFFLCSATSPGNDLRYSEEKLKSAWNFNNKLWNITRYVLQNTAEIDLDQDINIVLKHASSVDVWIIEKLNETIVDVNKNIHKYEFNELIKKIYDFTWDKFANWYLEANKIIINSEVTSKELKDVTLFVLKYTLEQIIKLLHPFMPYITTTLFQSIKGEDVEVYLEDYPKVINDIKKNNFESVIEVVTTLRNFKAENKLKPSHIIQINLETDINYSSIEFELIKKFAKIEISNSNFSEDKKITKILTGQVIVINEEGLFNEEEKILEISKDYKDILNEMKRSNKMLTNDNFINKAKPEKITDEKNKAATYLQKYNDIMILINNFEIKHEEFNVKEFEAIIK